MSNLYPSRFSSKTIGLFGGPILFLVTLLWLRPAGMSEQAVAVLASTLWIATWWITEAIPIAATSLLPIILFPLTGGLELSATTAFLRSPLHLFVYRRFCPGYSDRTLESAPPDLLEYHPTHWDQYQEHHPWFYARHGLHVDVDLQYGYFGDDVADWHGHCVAAKRQPGHH